MTLGVDMDSRRVVFATPGKDVGAIEKLKSHLEEKGTKKEAIEQVSIDMSVTFISGVGNCFPNADITFDRFHTVKVINQAMDSVRKLERQEFAMLKGHKYTFLKHDKNLSDKQKEGKYGLLTLYPVIANAYRLKEMFNELWTFNTIEEAGGFLSYRVDLLEESKIQPFIKAAKNIKAHWSGIVNYAKSKLTNGILEGINSRIQLVKREREDTEILTTLSI